MSASISRAPSFVTGTKGKAPAPTLTTATEFTLDLAKRPELLYGKGDCYPTPLTNDTVLTYDDGSMELGTGTDASSLARTSEWDEKRESARATARKVQSNTNLELNTCLRILFGQAFVNDDDQSEPTTGVRSVLWVKGMQVGSDDASDSRETNVNNPYLAIICSQPLCSFANGEPASFTFTAPVTDKSAQNIPITCTTQPGRLSPDHQSSGGLTTLAVGRDGRDRDLVTEIVRQLLLQAQPRRKQDQNGFDRCTWPPAV